MAWLPHSLPSTEREKAVCAGVAAMLVWFPALLITGVLIPFAIHMLVLGFIPLAMLLLVWWGAFCASLALSRMAVRALLSSGSE